VCVHTCVYHVLIIFCSSPASRGNKSNILLLISINEDRSFNLATFSSSSVLFRERLNTRRGVCVCVCVYVCVVRSTRVCVCVCVSKGVRSRESRARTSRYLHARYLHARHLHARHLQSTLFTWWRQLRRVARESEQYVEQSQKQFFSV